jgi:hypothetical protein
MSASNKIEFSYLNSNLMVVTVDPLTLCCNSRGGRPKADVSSRDGFDAGPGRVPTSASGEQNE